MSLLRCELYLIQQGLAFNGKRTKTARSQGKKFQVSVDQEATRLLGNLGWALMQQNSYIEAEDAYRRAQSVAPDSNKMCNLGICLMNQGRIVEAKDTLRRVKRAVSDGARGMDSHLKAYERAQQMLADLESEMMKKAGDSLLEQTRVFNTLLGSSSIWQPQPCRETYSSSQSKTTKAGYQFPDENTINSSILPNNNGTFQQKPVGSFNIDAQPFYSSKLVKDQHQPLGRNKFNERLKRTRSGTVENTVVGKIQGDESRNNAGNQERENKILRRSFEEEPEDKLVDLLPNDKDFEDAIISAVLNRIDAENSDILAKNKTKKFDIKGAARLKVFQDITLSLSPKA